MNDKYLVDTDVLIWYLKGNENAYTLIHSLLGFNISVITYMELIQGMRNKQELKILKDTFKKWNVKVLFIDEKISSEALFLVENYFLSHNMRLADALIAASGIVYELKLITANDKHYKFIEKIKIWRFRP